MGRGAGKAGLCGPAVGEADSVPLPAWRLLGGMCAMELDFIFLRLSFDNRCAGQHYSLGATAMDEAPHYSSPSEPGSAWSRSPFLTSAFLPRTDCPSAGPSVLSVVRSGGETRVHTVFSLFSTVDHTEVGWHFGNDPIHPVDPT